MRSPIKSILLPVIILAAGISLANLIINTGPSLNVQAPPPSAPLVRTWQASSQTVQMTTIAHGTVMPRTQSELIPEVSGRVIAISPAMVSGGFFRKDEVLLTLDSLDYNVAVEQARAALASAESELTNARRAHQRLLDLSSRQLASEAQQDDAANRLLIAEASLREKKARLARALRDLTRTKITAPYDGRVRSERVDVGQFVERGKSIASLYSTDFAEVRLPVHDEELAYLQLPLNGMVDSGMVTNGKTLAEVMLRARFAGKRYVWQGRIVRTEGELDPKTRMINLVAEVEAPYAQQGSRPPLAVGLFVEAEIIGTRVENVYQVPRSALQAGNQIYIIDGNNQLVFRDVDILRIVGEKVYIRSGFSAGETICLSTLSNAIQGMTVQPVDASGRARS